MSILNDLLVGEFPLSVALSRRSKSSPHIASVG